MDIEDLIREANPVQTGDLPAGDSPHARRALAQILQARAPRPTAGPAHRLTVGRSRSPRRARKRTLIMAGLTVAAAGVTAAAVLLAAPATAPAPAHATPAQLTTARQVLLTAAAHVASAPVTGRYWRVQAIRGYSWPGGTKSHPYDISLTTSYDQWNPRLAGQQEWEITQQLGTLPAAPADAAAWRAAGSPTTWLSGQKPGNGDLLQELGHYPPRTGALAATTAASTSSATWTVSDGTVGYIEGDLAGLKAAQFRQIPATAAGVSALLRHYYAETKCPSHPGSCSTEGQFIWSEALALLADPVSAQVRSATFEVMASLPGVRLLGPMTDPLGRPGYGLAAGPNGLSFARFNPVQAAVIDPHTGSLLATEDIGPMAPNVQCETLDATGPAAGSGKPVATVHLPRRTITATCIGSSYEGRSYRNQVDDYTVLVSAGWTNASPALPPSTHEDSLGTPGALPPVGL
jgi:hypothetical protein